MERVGAFNIFLAFKERSKLSCDEVNALELRVKTCIIGDIQYYKYYNWRLFRGIYSNICVFSRFGAIRGKYLNVPTGIARRDDSHVRRRVLYLFGFFVLFMLV